MSSLASTKKRPRKSSVSASTPKKQAARQGSQVAHPHPLRQTSFPKDFSSDARSLESGDVASDVPGTGTRTEDDDDAEEDEYGVTRPEPRRGENEGDGDGDEDEDEYDDDSTLFSSIKLKIREPSNGEQSRLASNRESKGESETSDTAVGNGEDGEEAGVNSSQWDELFPSPNVYGIDMDIDALNQVASSDPQLLEDLELLGVERTKRKKTFYPGMSQEELRSLISSFTEDQMDRYETFRRANVNRGGVKKLANAVLNQSITNNVTTALSGFSKVFLGEVVERALDVQQRMDPLDPLDPYAKHGPLRPEHIREAWRLYKIETGLVPAAHWRRAGGRGDGRMFR